MSPSKLVWVCTLYNVHLSTPFPKHPITGYNPSLFTVRTQIRWWLHTQAHLYTLLQTHIWKECGCHLIQWSCLTPSQLFLLVAQSCLMKPCKYWHAVNLWIWFQGAVLFVCASGCVCVFLFARVPLTWLFSHEYVFACSASVLLFAMHSMLHTWKRHFHKIRKIMSWEFLLLLLYFFFCCNWALPDMRNVNKNTKRSKNVPK